MILDPDKQQQLCLEETTMSSATTTPTSGTAKHKINFHIINSLKRPKSKLVNSNKMNSKPTRRQVILTRWATSTIHEDAPNYHPPHNSRARFVSTAIFKKIISIAIFATIMIVLQQATTKVNCDAICPKDFRPFYPCTCQNGTQGLLIKCAHSNLAHLSNSLRNLHHQQQQQDHQTVEQLEIVDSTVTKLFGPLFNDSTSYMFHSTIRELAVRQSGLKSIKVDDLSLELTNSLQYLSLDRNQLQQVPMELFERLTKLKALNLSSNLLSSVENNLFAKLTNLTELDLSKNRISKLSKNSFNALNSLEFLDLSGNELVKLEKNLFAFGRKLRHLDLSNNKLTTLDRQDFNELTVLETLRLSQNQLTTLPRSIFSRNAKLYQLDLSLNKLEDIDTYLFKSTRFLKDLNISGNLIKEITKNTFSPTTRIKRIDVSQNNLQSLSTETFKGLEWLESINLSHNQIVNISTDTFSRLYQVEINLSHNKLTRIFYWAFHEVSNMTKLDLSHNLLDDGISALAFDTTDCGDLDLSYNQIQDISKIPIGNLTNIKFLNLSYNQITEFNKKSFTQKVPLYELHTIDASHNNISQITGNILERLKSIRYIDLSYNTLRRLTSGAFGQSPTLLELDLSHNNLVEIVSGTLVGLISLKNLNLDYNRMKKMIPVPVALNSIHLNYNELGQLSRSSFPALNSLLELYLNYNRLTNVDEGTFATLSALHTLELSNNQLSSVPAAALKDLTSLQNLRLDGNLIQRLPRKAFGVLPIVFQLRLDHNNISQIADHAFEGMLQLLQLNLSHNQLSELQAETFAGLVALRQLDVSNNQLTRFENKTRSAMEDLLSLEVANFSSNKLSLITARTFLNSPYIPYRLVQLDLSNNLIGILVQHFSYGLKKLEWLSLRNNIINEIQLGVLSNMTHLKFLDLSHNKLRQLKEGTFDGGGGGGGSGQKTMTNLTTILLNNNKLTAIQSRELDRLAGLQRLDLSSNRLVEIFAETNHWIKQRGLAIDLSRNQLECTCDQLPLLAWIDNFRSRNSTYTMILNNQQSAIATIPTPPVNLHFIHNNNNNNYLTPRLLPQYIHAAQLFAQLNCTKPDTIGGKPIMQMLDLIHSSSEPFSNCDRDLIDQVYKLKRLKAPIQLLGAEPYTLKNGEQQLQIGWSLVDPQVDLLNFVLMKLRFQKPIDLLQLQTAGAPTASAAESNQLLEHQIDTIPYNERTWLLSNLDPSQFYVVCLTYETSSGEHSSSESTGSGHSSPTSLMKQLNSTKIDAQGKMALFSSMLADHTRIDCSSLNSLLRQDRAERLVSLSSSAPSSGGSVSFELQFLSIVLVQSFIIHSMIMNFGAANELVQRRL